MLTNFWSSLVCFAHWFCRKATWWKTLGNGNQESHMMENPGKWKSGTSWKILCVQAKFVHPLYPFHILAAIPSHLLSLSLYLSQPLWDMDTYMTHCAASMSGISAEFWPLAILEWLAAAASHPRNWVHWGSHLTRAKLKASYDMQDDVTIPCHQIKWWLVRKCSAFLLNLLSCQELGISRRWVIKSFAKWYREVRRTSRELAWFASS